MPSRKETREPDSTFSRSTAMTRVRWTTTDSTWSWTRTYLVPSRPSRGQPGWRPETGTGRQK
eukprot:8456192-Heterocapsa_arctica.AAC.1